MQQNWEAIFGILKTTIQIKKKMRNYMQNKI